MNDEATTTTTTTACSNLHTHTHTSHRAETREPFSLSRSEEAHLTDSSISLSLTPPVQERNSLSCACASEGERKRQESDFRRLGVVFRMLGKCAEEENPLSSPKFLAASEERERELEWMDTPRRRAVCSSMHAALYKYYSQRVLLCQSVHARCEHVQKAHGVLPLKGREKFVRQWSRVHKGGLAPLTYLHYLPTTTTTFFAMHVNGPVRVVGLFR